MCNPTWSATFLYSYNITHDMLLCTYISFTNLPSLSLFADVMEESDVWLDEDVQPLTGYSARPQSPIFTHKITNPLGISTDEARIARRKPSRDNLDEMFPQG